MSDRVRSNFDVLLGRLDRHDFHLGRAGHRQRGVLKHEHDLEQRRADRVAVRVKLAYDLIERLVLVSLGAERIEADPAEQSAEARVAR